MTNGGEDVDGRSGAVARFRSLRDVVDDDLRENERSKRGKEKDEKQKKAHSAAVFDNPLLQSGCHRPHILRLALVVLVQLAFSKFGFVEGKERELERLRSLPTDSLVSEPDLSKAVESVTVKPRMDERD
jgi:hypothetical protein